MALSFPLYKLFFNMTNGIYEETPKNFLEIRAPRLERAEEVSGR